MCTWKRGRAKKKRIEVTPPVSNRQPFQISLFHRNSPNHLHRRNLTTIMDGRRPQTARGRHVPNEFLVQHHQRRKVSSKDTSRINNLVNEDEVNPSWPSPSGLRSTLLPKRKRYDVSVCNKQTRPLELLLSTPWNHTTTLRIRDCQQNCIIISFECYSGVCR